METAQFTARVDSIVMRVIKKIAKQRGVSTNSEVNELLKLGLIARAQQKHQRKKASIGSTGPTTENQK